MRGKPPGSTGMRKRGVKPALGRGMTLFPPPPLAREALPPKVTPSSSKGRERRVAVAEAGGVAAGMGGNPLWAGEGSLGVDDPLDLAQRRQIGREGVGLGERRVSAEEVEAASLMRRRELLQEQPAEQPREHAHGQEEARAAR